MEELVTFETAKLAKKKGFNIDQLKGYYEHGDRQLALWVSGEDWNEQKDFICFAPTQTVLHKWMIEKHGMYIMVIPTITSDWTYKMITVISERDNDYTVGIKSTSDLPPYDAVCGQDFRTYEEALEHGMQQALKQLS